MNKSLLHLFFICVLPSVWGQTNQRIEVKGIVLSDTQDIENVTVFNRSSNKGIITNEKGEFVLEVALHDRIEISALQFEPLIVTIDEAVIATKQIRVYLREHVNNLDAVLLTYGLSGNLETDVANVKPQPAVEINFGNIDAYEFNDDRAFDNQVVSGHLNSVMNKGQLNNGINLTGLAGSFWGAIHKKKKHNPDNMQTPKKPKDISDVFSHEYISEQLDIPLDQIESFLVFTDSLGYNSKLLEKGNEIQLLELLVQQRKLFLNEEEFKN